MSNKEKPETIHTYAIDKDLSVDLGGDGDIQIETFYRRTKRWQVFGLPPTGDLIVEIVMRDAGYDLATRIPYSSIKKLVDEVESRKAAE